MNFLLVETGSINTHCVMPFACFGGFAKPWHPKPDACFLTKTTVPSGPGAGGPSLPLSLPAVPSRAGPTRALARACAMRTCAFFFFFFLTLAAADRGAGASAQACCSVRRQAARTKGGRKRFTGQRAPHLIQRTFSPGIMWYRRH